MGALIGRGRYARETYPDAGRGSNAQLIAQTQAVWWVDPVAGLPTANGLTSATPVDSFNTIFQRVTAGIVGVRPRWNPTGGLVTINVVNTTPVTDPLDVLLDADFMNGSSMIVQGVAKPATHTGTFTTVSAFARTNAAGQTQITDATVPNFAPFVPSLLVDSQANGVAFLALPTSGASATGTISVPYGPQTAGGIPFPSIVTPANGDAYSLIPLVGVYMGSTFSPRQFPQSHGTFGAVSQVNIYRLQPTGLAASDLFHVSPDVTARVFFQECLFVNVTPSVGGGTSGVFFANCGLAQTSGNSLDVEPTGNCTLYAGGYYRQPWFSNGNLTLDNDVAYFASANGQPPISNGPNAQLTVGNASFWMVSGGPGEALAIEDGAAFFGFSFTGNGVCYGNAVQPLDFIFFTPSGRTQTTPMTLRLNPALTFTAAFQFNTGGAAQFGMGGTGTAFSPNQVTGAFIGPTNPTLTNLDASPAAAGTALAGNAIGFTWWNRIVKG